MELRIKQEFPLYKKYRNEKTFFRILSDNEFEEIQLIGTKKFCFNSYKANLHPDRMVIKDLIESNFTSVETITENEYIAMFDYCMRKLKKVK